MANYKHTFAQTPTITWQHKAHWEDIDPFTDEHKAVFFHIPKAGGTSLKSNHVNIPGLVYVGHKPVADHPLEITNLKIFKFTITRNPYDRLLSAYSYLTSGNGNDHDTAFGKKLSSDFNCFVKTQLHEKMTAPSEEREMENMHLFSMSFWINGEIDFAGKLENYQADLNYICDKIGATHVQIPYTNSSKHKHYTECYDDESREIVREVYKEDFERFNYEWGQ